jgi:hypothetical protein
MKCDKILLSFLNSKQNNNLKEGKMRVIKAAHLLFARSLPNRGSKFVAQCGKELQFEGFLPNDMVDNRMCKECAERINGFSVLSSHAGLKCFVVLEFSENV